MYTPKFKGEIEGYVVNHLKRNLWRIASTHDHRDAMQEAYLVFMRCCDKYPQTDTPQHFMALFKQAWTNRIIDLSAKSTKARAMVSAEVEGLDGDYFDRDVVGELDNAGYLLTLLRQAPAEVLLVLNLFLNAPKEVLDLATATWEQQGRRKGGESKLLARMLGLPEGSDPIKATRDYFLDTDRPV